MIGPYSLVLAEHHVVQGVVGDDVDVAPRPALALLAEQPDPGEVADGAGHGRRADLEDVGQLGGGETTGVRGQEGGEGPRRLQRADRPRRGRPRSARRTGSTSGRSGSAIPELLQHSGSSEFRVDSIGMTDVIVTSGLRKSFGPTVALDGLDLHRRRGRDPRLPRPQRGGQVDDDPGPARPAASRRRDTPPCSAGTRGATRRAASPGRLRRRATSSSGRTSPAARSSTCSPGCAAGSTSGGAPSSSSLRARPDEEGPLLLQGQPAEGRPRRRPGLRRPAPHPRRAHRRPRPLMESDLPASIARERQQGRTVLLSSHMLSEVEKACDRVSIVRGGAHRRQRHARRAASPHPHHRRATVRRPVAGRPRRLAGCRRPAGRAAPEVQLAVDTEASARSRPARRQGHRRAHRPAAHPGGAVPRALPRRGAPRTVPSEARHDHYAGTRTGRTRRARARRDRRLLRLALRRDRILVPASSPACLLPSPGLGQRDPRPLQRPARRPVGRGRSSPAPRSSASTGRSPIRPTPTPSPSSRR